MAATGEAGRGRRAARPAEGAVGAQVARPEEEAAAGPRVGRAERRTAETEVAVTWTLEGRGRRRVETGLPFFDHLLGAFTLHGSFDLEVRARGDLEVEAHHTVEDVGIVMGRALRAAVGDGAGIARFGWACLPMDEALVLVSLDLSGRPYLAWDVELAPRDLGGFHTELAVEFWRALCNHAGLTLHVRRLAGVNTHHLLEIAWKAAGRALAQAVARPGPGSGPAAAEGPGGGEAVPSTKGLL